ncbi:MAG: hypothetical protein A2X12_04645 [Bacteroidetes bacterium GWE2_29_8]|nr:MAG: hypothetical protein A2X12_04645 [Bacteroidetes bacterium GWE2_29_8]
MKNFIPHIIAVFLFLLVSVIYFYPILDGKDLVQEDIMRYKGMSQEAYSYKEKTGEEILWTGSMFSGMPTTQISLTSHNNLIIKVKELFTLGFPYPMFVIFHALLGFYFLLQILKVNRWLSIAGAFAFAFSSYNMIIINAGHTSKIVAISLMAPVIASIIMTLRGNYLLGGALTALFVCFQLLANHAQITYYLFIAIIVLVIVHSINAIKNKEIEKLLKSFAVLIFAGILAIIPNITTLWTTLEYSQYTTRGKSELTDTKQNKTTGLDKDYATAWSYGIAETWTLMIPNFKGGETKAIGHNEQAVSSLKQSEYRQNILNQNHYWGDQPFTAGPVYMGAIVIFLFVLGIFFANPYYRWWLITASAISIVLAWGKNFMIVTDFFLDYVPAYNKFRAVSMTLVIAQLTIPLLGFLGLNYIIEKKDELKNNMKYFYIAFGATGGLCLLFWLMPTVFNSFFGSEELFAYNNQKNQSPEYAQMIDLFLKELEHVRIYIFKADAIRSFVYIFLVASVLLLYIKNIIKSKEIVIGVIGLLILVDLWNIDRRYLNESSFVPKENVEIPFPKTLADEEILKDKDPNFRVLNLSVSTFNDAGTSYYHKSIGGYHGAKLKRYQELIEYHISKNNMNVLNMLNAKYVIVPDEKKQPIVQRNPEALGNAWFVNEYKIVANADSEIVALNNFNPSYTTFIDKRFEKYISNFVPQKDTLGYIKLTDYNPNRLKYISKASSEQFGVFSEIYYDKGWNAYIDGKLVEHIRVNYVLRGLKIPAGEHNIEFKFEPQSYYVGEKISLAGSLILILTLLLAFAKETYDYVKQKK